MKRLEKPQIINNREYLDMDTDEEEFGRQETPEPEEEPEIELEKPVFTDEELAILVRYVKDLTTLSRLEISNWPEESIEIIKEYFCNPSNMTLTIFYDAKILKSRLSFPIRKNCEFTYFLRNNWQIYTPDNFLTTVIFGSVGDGIEMTTLKYVENMYAPIAFSSNNWPSVTRNEVFSLLHEFLMSLTDATYNPLGLAMLYMPGESLVGNEKKNFQAISNESTIYSTKKIYDNDNYEIEGLIERLERIARYWTQRIRQTINGIHNSAKSSPYKTIIDEIHYWQYKYENFSCLCAQLTNKNVESIVKKLKNERSTSVKDYNILLAEVQRMTDEARSNIMFLSLMNKPGDEMGQLSVNIEEYETRMLLLIKFIGTESPYYRSEKKMEKLCSALGSQIVAHLQRHLILDLVFDGDPSDARKIILDSINCCNKLDEIYDRIVEMDKSFDIMTISKIDKGKVFRHVVTFVERCGDLLGMVDSRMAFDKSEYFVRIFGPRRIEFRTMYRKIEKEFCATLSEIKNARDDFLDFVTGNWLKRVKKFKSGMKSVENMVKNWINVIFENVLNVEEGIEALYGIKEFMKRINLCDAFNDKWIQIWKSFGEELESYSILMERDSKISHHSSLPIFSGSAHLIRNKKIYLTTQYKMLIDASDWLDDFDPQFIISEKYKSVLAALSAMEEALFHDWKKYLTNEKRIPEAISNELIIKYRDEDKMRTVEINAGTDCINDIREIAEWTILNYETTNIFSKNCPKLEKLMIRYNKAELICNLYNIYLETFSKSEYFSTFFDEFEDTARIGFEKMTWCSERFDKYFNDFIAAATKV